MDLSTRLEKNLHNWNGWICSKPVLSGFNHNVVMLYGVAHKQADKILEDMEGFSTMCEKTLTFEMAGNSLN